VVEFLLWILFILSFCLASSMIARKQRRPDFLIATFAALVVLANITAVKQVEIAGLFAPAAVIAYSVTFLLTDMLAEHYSKRDAHRAVWAGFYANLLLVAVVLITLKMTPAPFWGLQAEYEKILGLVPRIVFASMTAFLVSQHLDVIQFHLWKKKTGGRYLWLRNNASTMVSQLIDTTLFITIAFYGVFPILPVIKGQYLIKLAIAVLDTPFIYLSRWIYQRS
jgi:hypothetical protein